MKRVAMLLACALSSAGDGERSWLLDDFEQGDLVAAPGLHWIGITDALMGGGSRLRLTAIEGGAQGSRRAMRAAGVVEEKGFAGTWVALEPEGRIADVSGFEGIRLQVRGTGDVLVGLRDTRSPGSNFMAAVSVGPAWGRVDVPFSSLKPTSGSDALDPKAVRFLGVQQPAGSSGSFSFDVDTVELYGNGPGVVRPSSAGGASYAVRIHATPIASLRGLRWETLALDPRGDGTRPSLPDATGLRIARQGSVVWFRLDLAAPPPEDFIGVNLALDMDGDPANGMAWWGKNTAFKFDRLVTGYAYHLSEDPEGMFGIADAASIEGGNMIDRALGSPRLAIDRKAPAVLVGIDRGVLGTRGRVRVVAAVGSARAHNDDVPDAEAVLVGP